MPPKIYKLFHDNILIANITQTDADFPNLFGTFTLAKAIPPHVQNYIEYRINISKFKDISSKEPMEYIKQNDGIFLDLIESEAWYLLDEQGTKDIIMSPHFRSDSSIVWRWT